MELELRRTDLLQTTATAPGCLAVLPPGEARKPQKVAVGDASGVVQCFSVKKGEVVSSFKSLPTAQRVTALVAGGAKAHADRLFVAAGARRARRRRRPSLPPAPLACARSRTTPLAARPPLGEAPRPPPPPTCAPLLAVR